MSDVTNSILGWKVYISDTIQANEHGIRKLETATQQEGCFSREMMNTLLSTILHSIFIFEPRSSQTPYAFIKSLSSDIPGGMDPGGNPAGGGCG